VHLAAIWLLSRLFASLDMDWLRPRENSWRWLFLVGAGTVPVGGLIASFIFGLNLWITSRFCDINHNDAFSSMRLDSYRHFLRLRIKDNELTVYPVALDRVPARHEWRENADPAPGTVGSRFIPPEDVKPRLIEPAFTVRAREVDVVTETVTPQVLQGTTPTSPPPSAQDPAKPPSPPT
jgi:hypothetical protein